MRLVKGVFKGYCRQSLLMLAMAGKTTEARMEETLSVYDSTWEQSLAGEVRCIPRQLLATPLCCYEGRGDSWAVTPGFADLGSRTSR